MYQRTAAFTIVLTAIGTAAPAQTVIPEAVSCAKCTIDVRTITRIGALDGPGSIPARPSSVIFDGRARYWVSPMEYFPLVYDSNGKFLREFGKKGNGPGEFRAAWATLALPGDSVLLHADRHFVVVAPDLTHARALPHDGWNFMPHAMLRWPAVFGVTMDATKRETQLLWRAVDMSGKSLKPGTPVYGLPAGHTGEQYAAAHRVASNVVRDHYWVANVSSYRVMRHSLTGAPQDSFTRQLKWFPNGGTLRWGSKTVPPAPKLQHVWEDQSGLVWVVVAEPRPNYARAWDGKKPRGNEGRLRDFPSNEQLWRTFVEVIDPRAKRVVARRTIDEYVLSVLPANRVATSRENEDGIPFVTIHQLTLNRN